MRRALLAAAAAIICAASAPAGATSCGTAQFGILDGQIYGPDQKPFVPSGINVIEGGNPSAATLQAEFPSINFVRLAIYDYASAATLKPYIDDLTSHGIVVLVEDHHTSDGSNAGGGSGTVFTGQQLATEMAWYADISTTFKGNPRVWEGMNNEPPANPSMAALAAWQVQTYDTIRATGNNNPILIELMGGGIPSMPNAALALSAADLAKMDQVAIDLHYYGWDSNFSTDKATVANNLMSTAAAATSIQSAGGKMPVLIGEYGSGGDGGVDAPNGPQVDAAVAASGYGNSAWAWGQGLGGLSTVTGSGSLTGFGQLVAGVIKAVTSAVGAATPSGCTAAAAGSSTVAAAATTSTDPFPPQNAPTQQDPSAVDQVTAAQAGVAAQEQRARQAADAAQQQISDLLQQRASVMQQIEAVLHRKSTGGDPR